MRLLIFILSLLICSCNYLIKPKSKIVDKNFAAAIREQCPLCIDKDNYLTKNADTLAVLDVGSRNIATLEGFNFKGLVEFSCNDNQITALPDNLPASLEDLYCHLNLISVLPENLPASLEILICMNNKLTSLPGNLPKKLRHLQCGNNQITFLPNNLPTNLKVLGCNNNLIKFLPIFLPTNLEYF